MTGLLAALSSPDPRVRVVLATRLATLAAAPITLLLVMTQLAPGEQGLYFIFVNVFALSQLFEIGVGSLVVQYASHELPNLTWGPSGAIHAEESTLLRMRWMLRRLVRWYGIAAAIVVTLAVLLGVGLFSVDLRRQVPATSSMWLITVIATGAYLPLIPVLNTIEGCGRLIDVQRMRLMQAILTGVSSWILIPSLGGLVAVGINAALQFGVAALWLSRRYPAMIRFAWDAAKLNAKLGPRPATLELDRLYLTQLRTAAVWVSAHIAAQGLTPLVLYYHGAALAGRMGATLAITTVPYTIGMSWLQGRLPDFGALAARGRHSELDASAKNATLHAAVVCFVGLAAVLCGIGFIERFVPDLRDRILPVLPAAALGGAALVGLLLQAMAGYIRAYRTEPLVRVLIGGYAGMFGAAWISAARFGPAETAVAYFLVSAGIALPATAFMLRHARKKLVLARADGSLGST